MPLCSDFQESAESIKGEPSRCSQTQVMQSIHAVVLRQFICSRDGLETSPTLKATAISVPEEFLARPNFSRANDLKLSTRTARTRLLTTIQFQTSVSGLQLQSLVP